MSMIMKTNAATNSGVNINGSRDRAITVYSHVHTRSAHAGQILIMAAAGLVLLIGVLAAAIDVGMLLAQRRAAQNAADAASMAAAHAMYTGIEDQATLEAIATYYLQQNGFDDTPQVEKAEVDGVKEVRVTLTHNAPKFFVGVVYPGPWKVKTTAVSALEPNPKDYALLALSEDGTPIQFGGNGSLNVVDGGAMSNGAISCRGNAELTADLTVDAHTGQYTSGNCGFSGATGENPNAPVVPDPLKTLAPPQPPPTPAIGNPAACTANGNDYICPPGNLSSSISAGGNGGSITFSAGNHQVINKNISGSGNNPTITLYPGTYYFQNSTISLSGNNNSLVFKPGRYTFYMDGGGITFSGNSDGYRSNDVQVNFYFHNSSVTFNGNTDTSLPPGLYHFDGGSGPQLTGNKTITGENVFFYFSNGASWQTAGNTEYQLSAPATNVFGSWYPDYQPHLLMFGERTGDTSVSQTFLVRGNSGIHFDGVVYLPNAKLDVSGNFSGTWATGQLIVHSLTYTGNSRAQVVYKDYVDITVPRVYLIQ